MALDGADASRELLECLRDAGERSRDLPLRFGFELGFEGAETLAIALCLRFRKCRLVRGGGNGRLRLLRALPGAEINIK